MRPSLTSQRCLNHTAREAVARCPRCRDFYCRECITEHAGRVICSACLMKLSIPVAAPRRSRWRALVRPFQLLAGLLLAWTFFYFVGRVLLLVPSSFHEGTVWQEAKNED